MKRILQMAALALIVMLGSSLRNTASAQPDDYGYESDPGGPGGPGEDYDVSYQTFYDELSPHGRWIDYPQYGYVWVPNGIQGFRPYETGGRWVWTDGYEWMWVSDYSWGWAPFHYGRWFQDPFYGWMWVPGYEWAPAWVAWRDGGDYYGWAPLRPGINISLNFSFGNYNPPVDYWCFAPRRYINSPRIYSHVIDRSRNVTIINNTTIINNYSRRNNVFVNGPRRIDAERYAGRINPVRFREASRAGRTQFRNNEVSVYRPRVQRNNNNNNRFSPRSFDRYDRNNNNVANRGNGNNLPNRNGNNNRFERRDNNTARPQQNGSGNRFERRNDVERGNDQQGNNNRNEDRRRNIFERRNSNLPGNNDRTIRTPQQRNPEVRSQENNRRFERREQRPQVERPQPRQPEARQERPQVDRQPRQFERRQERPQVDRQPRQSERQSQPRVERQSQPRQFENRGNNSQQRSSGNGNGNGGGRRFERRGN